MDVIRLSSLFFALKRIEFSLCKVNAYVSSMNRILILCVLRQKAL